MHQLLSRITPVLLVVILTGCGGSSSSDDTNASDAIDSDATPSSNEAVSTDLRTSFVNFESGQVRPLALTSDGSRLLVTNTPASTLDLFNVTETGLELAHSIAVGMEPVSVALFNDSEAWVVNHLSDSISIIDLSVAVPMVTKTLLVADEPRDIVFAGPNKNLAFITTAHRGQNGPDDNPVQANLTTPSIGRTDVWVFDANDTGDSLGGKPVSVVSMFGDTARALSVSSDASEVYVAVMHSGNRTTAIGENFLEKTGPVNSADGAAQPDTGLIVQFDGSNWIDSSGGTADLNDRNYNELVPFSLPDFDVFALSATTTPTVLSRYTGVGTTLFNMTTNPVNGEVYVSNTEALNLNRFEGSGIAGGSIRGNFIENRISVIKDNNVEVVDLNQHIDRSSDFATADERAQSISQPLGMAITDDGSTLYVAAFGSGKLMAYNTSSLNNGDTSDAVSIPLGDGGPTGVVLDENRDRAYVLTRFNNAVAIVDTVAASSLNSVALFNPEPAHVIQGRALLYAAQNHSRFGDMSCASCHIFGDADGMAWDLGNPDAMVKSNPNEFVNQLLEPSGPATFHPMKGPMGTQSLRGLANSGPMHWRGDRTGENRTANESLELAAFKEFNEAFPELLGSVSEVSDTEMTEFAEFALTITYPPNPIRALDNSLNPDQAAGRSIYMNDDTTGDVFTCNDCHTISLANNHFGTSGRSSVEGPNISQEFKVPHIRNMYQKVGKFGNSGRFSSTDLNQGDQIRGYGFMHDGNMDTLDSFLQGSVFRFAQDDAVNDRMRAQVVEFVMAADSDLAPIVGQQITLDSDSSEDTKARLELLRQRASVSTPKPECDLIAKGNVANVARGFLLQPNGSFQSDSTDERYSFEELTDLARAPGGALTFTCVPPGSGVWMGIDRDENGVLDLDE